MNLRGGLPHEKDGGARRARRHQRGGEGEGAALALYCVYDPRTGLVLLLNLSMI